MSRLARVSRATELAIGRIRRAKVSISASRDLVLTIVPEVESRIDDMLREVVNKTEFASTTLGSFLIKDNIDSYFRTWPERQKILKSASGLDMNGSTTGQEFTCLLDVRNSLMHGNGSLTSQQTKNSTSLKRNLTATLAVQFHGQKLILDRLDRQKVCDAACNYLALADSHFPSLQQY